MDALKLPVQPSSKFEFGREFFVFIPSGQELRSHWRLCHNSAHPRHYVFNNPYELDGKQDADKDEGYKR